MARLLLGVVALLVVASPAASAEAVDLIGTWHVLVHYKDSVTDNPERERWEDRIWVFEPEGSRLRWTDYPIVVFSDQTGRFEQLGGNRASRALHFWEPNAGQLAQIHEGLEINPRGSKSKTLRRSDTEGWSSGSPSRGIFGHKLTYTETWRLEDPTGLPVFSIEESLGGLRAESLDGLTE